MGGSRHNECQVYLYLSIYNLLPTEDTFQDPAVDGETGDSTKLYLYCVHLSMHTNDKI